MPGPAMVGAHWMLAKTKAWEEARPKSWWPMTAPAAGKGVGVSGDQRCACRKLSEAVKCNSSKRFAMQLLVLYIAGVSLRQAYNGTGDICAVTCISWQTQHGM